MRAGPHHITTNESNDLMPDMYYSPEKFGLTVVGEVEFEGGYGFDKTMVWRDRCGTLMYADDSGCSCPTPFEGKGVNDLTVATVGEIQEHLMGRVKKKLEPYEDEYFNSSTREQWNMKIADLLSTIITS